MNIPCRQPSDYKEYGCNCEECLARDREAHVVSSILEEKYWAQMEDDE